MIVPVDHLDFARLRGWSQNGATANGAAKTMIPSSISVAMKVLVGSPDSPKLPLLMFSAH
jgi:hypothetical protein